MSDADGTCEYVLDPDDPETWGGEKGDECYVDEEILNRDGMWTCPHDAEDGKEHCIFHIRVEEKDDEKVAETFADMLENVTGQEDYYSENRQFQFLGAQFGRFDVSEDSLEAAAEDAKIILSHATIKGKLYWSDAVFDVSAIKMSGVEFVEYSEFIGTEFGEEVDFQGANFGGKTSFRDAKFKGQVDFDFAKFGTATDFRWTEFGGVVSFESAGFDENVSFQSAEFSQKVSFMLSEFGGEVRFFEVEFSGEADFKHAEFRGVASLDRQNSKKWYPF